jgi:Protein of unknown function (DUF1207)
MVAGFIPRSSAGIFALLFTAAVAGAGEEKQAVVASMEEAPMDCRYSHPPEDREPGSFEGVLLPKDDVFRPLLADPKESRFYASYQRMRFKSRGIPGERHGKTIDAGLAAFGADFGLAGLRQKDGCDGMQVGLFGGVFSQFNLDTPSSDLINTDFVGGIPLTLRRGPLSFRGRLYHQSSHLGDEFLLDNPDVDRVNLSFEAIDALLSLTLGPVRVYGGGGYLLRTEPDLDRGIAQWGAEMRLDPVAWPLTSTVRALPVFGGDFHAYQEQSWNVTSSATGGLELANVLAGRRVRLMFVYLNGFLPFSQFFNTERIESYGFAAQFEL